MEKTLMNIAKKKRKKFKKIAILMEKQSSIYNYFNNKKGKS